MKFSRMKKQKQKNRTQIKTHVAPHIKTRIAVSLETEISGFVQQNCDYEYTLLGIGIRYWLSSFNYFCINSGHISQNIVIMPTSDSFMSRKD